MPVIDISILIIIAGFAMFGVWFGFFHTLGSLVGTIAGIFLGSRYYEPMSDWLISVTGWGENISRVLMFTISFFVINRAVGFAFYLVDRFLHVVTRLPFIASMNRFFGLLLGVLEGVITLGMIIFFIERFPISERVMGWIAASNLAPHLSDFAAKLWPLLPEALRLLHSTVQYVEKVVI